MFLSSAIATILVLWQHSSASALPTSPTLNKGRVHTWRIPLFMIYKIYLVIWKQNNLLLTVGHFKLVLLLKIKKHKDQSFWHEKLYHVVHNVHCLNWPWTEKPVSIFLFSRYFKRLFLLCPKYFFVIVSFISRVTSYGMLFLRRTHKVSQTSLAYYRLPWCFLTQQDNFGNY